MLVISNFAAARLTAAIAEIDLVLTVGDASVFPDVSAAGDYFYLTLTNHGETVFEIVRVNEINGNDLTIIRGQEGTTTAAWAIDDAAELRPTAATTLEAPTNRFMSLLGALAESVTGVKLFINGMATAVGVELTLRGKQTNSSSGNFSLFTDNGDITWLRKRNAAGDAWIPVMQVAIDGVTTLPLLTGYVDLTTAQDVGGQKRIMTGLSFLNARGIQQQGAGNVTDGDGSFNIITRADNITSLEKQVGGNWLPVIEINASTHILMQQLVICSNRIHMENNQEIRFANAAGATDGLGANRILNNSFNTFQIQWHNGTEWKDGINLLADGRIDMVSEQWLEGRTTKANNSDITFRNAANAIDGDGAKRILNDASNNWALQHYLGGGWGTRIELSGTNGQVILNGLDGSISARVENAGTALDSAQAIVTKEKGDARYAPIAEVQAKQDQIDALILRIEALEANH